MAKQTFTTNSDIAERRRFEVIKRNKRSEVVGVSTSDGSRKFNFGQGHTFYVEDEGVAHDLHDTLGQGGSNDVLVVPIEKGAKGRTRTFTVPALPWHDKE